jgi:glucose/arabinose dehydrogenase
MLTHAFSLVKSCGVGTFWAFFALSVVHAQPKLTLITNQVTSPVDIASLRDGETMLVVQQAGRIVRLERDQLNTSTAYLDISDRVLAGGERGLLGIAVHPQYASNGYVYVNYTRRPDGATVISRFTRDASDSRRASPASEKVLLTIDQPYANHNGGALRFGADGFLYIGMGDGGSGNDPQNYAQNMQSLLGKMLRIDVNRGDPYAVPNDNPFAPNPTLGKPEIFAAGLRNPWRFSVDRQNGDIYIGDVGQGALEEVSLIGSVTTLQFPRELINFGWRTFEGTRCTNLDGAAACAAGRFTPPILEYGRSEGASITGGVRYTGSKVAELSNGQHYIFGDFVSGTIWQATRAANGAWSRKVLLSTGGNVAGFGEDDSGEVYVLDYSKGVFKLASNTTPVTEFIKTAVEYFNTPLQHYFVTADAAEQRSVESGGAGPGWSRTGQSFRVINDVSTLLPAPGVFLANVCRFYGTPGRGPNSHFYTADDGECSFVKRDAGWTFEGNVFFVARKGSSNSCASGYVPVYRSYNNRFAQNDSNHRYTTDASIHAGMVRNGWVDEGVVFCAVAP